MIHFNEFEKLEYYKKYYKSKKYSNNYVSIMSFLLGFFLAKFIFKLSITKILICRAVLSFIKSVQELDYKLVLPEHNHVIPLKNFDEAFINVFYKVKRKRTQLKIMALDGNYGHR